MFVSLKYKVDLPKEGTVGHDMLLADFWDDNPDYLSATVELHSVQVSKEELAHFMIEKFHGGDYTDRVVLIETNEWEEPAPSDIKE